ncbi:MAG TPA: hypothetical protein PLQ89_08910 [Phycisphaerae bacterium]|nr:hypothetical protein [Phycisphaerae bacterium]
MGSRRITNKLGLLDVLRHASFAGLVLRDLMVAPGHRRLHSTGEHLQAVMDWLCRAQDASVQGGMSSGYSWLDGWQGPYPETTGYVIPTFLEFARVSGQTEFVERARRMADWEIEIQLPSGAVRGGIGVNEYPIVFNTGQMILGWTAMYRHGSDPKYLQAARRAADWLVSVQDEDGKWSRHEYNSIPHAYHTRVAWPMLQVFALRGESAHREAAVRNIEWVLSLVQENGWIREMAFKRTEWPYTHTIAYTLRGLHECARLLDGPIVSRIDAVVRRACETLLMKYECRKRDPRGAPEYLAGTFDDQWRPAARYCCLTGCAQLAILFIKRFQLDGDPRLLNAALKLIDQVRATQSLRAINPGIRGAVAGSYPIWGGYIRYGYPNWAAKFLADALMLSEQVLARLRQEAAT